MIYTQTQAQIIAQMKSSHSGPSIKPKQLIYTL